MTREEFFKYQEETFNKLLELTRKKNADYAGSGGDAFNNFTRIETIGVATTEQGFLTRMFDKFSRIISFMQNGELQVKDESVEDTLLDLANYCVLMSGYLKSKKLSKQNSLDELERLKAAFSDPNILKVKTNNRDRYQNPITKEFES